jgi:hypothetical protein
MLVVLILVSFAHTQAHTWTVVFLMLHNSDLSVQVLGDEEKRTKYDRGEDLEEPAMGHGGFGHNFAQGGQTFTFHFEGGFPGGFGFH